MSGIQNAPRIIDRLTPNLRNLSNVLEQLDSFGDDLYLASELPRLTSKCAENMREFETMLCKLNSPKQKKVARPWKNVKATLQENKIDRMSALLQQDFMAFDYQMNIIR